MADSAAEYLLAPLESEQLDLLKLVGEVFNLHGRWPVYGWVAFKWKQSGRRGEAAEVLASMPSVGHQDRLGRYGAMWSTTRGGSLMHDATVGLTLLGRHHVGQATEPYLSVIRLLANAYSTSDPDPFEFALEPVTWDQLKREQSIAHWLRNDGNHLYEALRSEPPSWGVAMTGSTWEVPLTSRMSGFGRATSIENYVDLVCSMLLTGQSRRARVLMASPLSLLAQLDYLDVVWRLSTGKPSIVELPSAERTASLALPVEGSADLDVRLATLGEVMKGLRVPGVPGVGGHPLVRLQKWLEQQAGFDIGLSVEAFSDLSSIVDLRNGLVHPSSRDKVRTACEKLGVDWPIVDHAAVWNEIETRAADALASLRVAIADLASS